MSKKVKMLELVRVKPVNWIEATCDEYGNSLSIHYVDGQSRLVPGLGTRQGIYRALGERCISMELYRQKMKACLGKDNDFPIWLASDVMLVPIRTRKTVYFSDGRRSGEDVYSFYNYHEAVDLDLGSSHGCIYLKNGVELKTIQSGNSNEKAFDEARKLVGLLGDWK